MERFDRWAATYDQAPMQRWLLRPAHAKMLDLIAQERPDNPPHSIIDVGCGTGRLLQAASVRWPEVKLFGVDPAEHMIMEARHLNPDGIFNLGLAESLPFPDQVADLVLSSLSFHHWADQKKGLQEIARVLRPGGWLCLADHTFVLSKLVGTKVRTGGQVRKLISDVGLDLRQHRRVRFILVTLAQKPMPGESLGRSRG